MWGIFISFPLDCSMEGSLLGWSGHPGRNRSSPSLDGTMNHELHHLSTNGFPWMQMTFKPSGSGFGPPALCSHPNPTQMQTFKGMGSFTCTASLLSQAGHKGARTRAKSHKSQDHPREGPPELTLARHSIFNAIRQLHG